MPCTGGTMMGMLSAHDTITRLGGLARGDHLQQLGFTRTQLSRLVARGQIERIRHGVFAVGSLDDDTRTALAHGGALCCASVLQRRHVWLLVSPAAPHVWLGHRGRPLPHPQCACVSHYFRGPVPFGRTGIETALVQYRSCCGDEAFFAAFESAWRSGLLTRAARARIRSRLPGTARWLVDLARPDADSGLESLLRLRLHILGIHLACQVEIRGVGRVDFVIDGHLILEADGKINHDGVTMRHKDLVRDAAASRLGYETLRFDYAQIIHDWPTVQAAILAARRRLRRAH
ncbi:type IV toxin-antitoxin system AbiEi family antitoxin domain-containing protein [Microbacterium soli]|uniref:DUF559 domain-containing protein n=1 Tax=Microbacterium soli TaxID=446075 RepID=A0ABP7MRV5_9MICO